MVFTYIRKTERASWSESTMNAAINDAKKSSIKAASSKYGIPYSTLQRRVKTGSSTKKLGRFTPIFTDTDELELVDHVKELDAVFYGLTKREFLKVVGDFAKRKNKQTTFKNGKAGKQWFRNFKKRHPEIVLRTPESTSIARLQAFNKPAVNRFYDLLETTIEKHNIRSDMIYNMDETGVRTTSTRPPKVLSIHGKKQVGMVSSLEKGTLTTVVCCCSASGNFAPPPFFIFKRKRFQARLLDGSLPGCEASVSDSGWINGEIFLEWLRVFVSFVRPTQDCKALLILDNHESHKFYPALEYATEHNVEFVSIPPHTSHKLQPLDVSVYSPFKTFFEIEINKFQKAHPGRVIGQYDIAKLVTQAYLKAATPSNALSGFRSAGIHPFDRHAIGDEHFAPSAVYNHEQEAQEEDHHQTRNNTSTEPMSAVPPNVESGSVQQHLQEPMDIVTQQNLESEDVFEPIESAARENESVPVGSVPMELNLPDTMDPMDGAITPPITEPENSSVLQEILPLPQSVAKNTKKRRQLQKAEILTSTPIKIQQMERFLKCQVKKEKTIKTLSGKKKSKQLKTTKTPSGKENSKKLKTTKTLTGKNDQPSSSGVKKGQSSTSTKPKKNFYCLICKEVYVDPPTEEWIMCSQCKEWAHESCTAYSGHGSYFCDLCFD